MKKHKTQHQITQQYIKHELELTGCKKELPQIIIKSYMLSPLPDYNKHLIDDLYKLYLNIISVYDRQVINSVMARLTEIKDKTDDKVMINYFNNIDNLLLLCWISGDSIYQLVTTKMIKKLITNKEG